MGVRIREMAQSKKPNITGALTYTVLIWNVWQIIVSLWGGGAMGLVFEIVSNLPRWGNVVSGIVVFFVLLIVFALLGFLFKNDDRETGPAIIDSTSAAQAIENSAAATGAGQAMVGSAGAIQIARDLIFNISFLPGDVKEKTWTKGEDVSEDGNNLEIHVTSHGQQGGITAGIVNIAAESAPNITLGDQSHMETENGHLYEAILNIETKYVVPNLRIVAHAHTILSLDVAPQASGMFMFGHTGKREGFHFTTLQNAAGRYRVRVTTSEPEQVKIDFGA